MLRVACTILVIFALIAGTLLDTVPVTAPAERGEYKVIQADFHVHSFFGGGVVSPFNMARQAHRQGLHAIALTNHNEVYSARLGRWYANLVGGPTVLVGQEIAASDYHIIGVGLDKTVDWRQPAQRAIEEVHRQGGAAIAAHPTADYWPTYSADIVEKLDGAEVMHQMAYHEAEKWQEIRDFYVRVEKTGRRLTAIGSSDHHAFNSLGICRTYVFVKDNTETEIIKAIRTGHTVVYDLEGNAYGHPELIRLLEENPIKRTGNYNYAHSSIIDLISRTLGWVGLIGLVLFGKRKTGFNDAVVRRGEQL